MLTRTLFSVLVMVLLVGGAGTAARAATSCEALQPALVLHAGSTLKVVRPRLLHAANPQYPSWLRSQPVHRRVSVCVLVDAAGRVSKTAFALRSGYPALDASAQRAALDSRFAPGTVNGQSTSMAMQLDYRFDVP